MVIVPRRTSTPNTINMSNEAIARTAALKEAFGASGPAFGDLLNDIAKVNFDACKPPLLHPEARRSPFPCVYSMFLALLDQQGSSLGPQARGKTARCKAKGGGRRRFNVRGGQRTAWEHGGQELPGLVHRWANLTCLTGRVAYSQPRTFLDPR